MNCFVISVCAGLALTLGLTNCGTYKELSPAAQSVTATTVRPTGSCKSLGTLTGKGGGASGGYVSNESLIEYAVNDLRNQGAMLGATHIVYSAPSMGGHEGTTTSAMVMGEALDCAARSEAPIASAQAVTPAKRDTPTKAAGCEYDTQCKGDRVCVDHQCVAPAASAVGSDATAAPAASGRH